MVAWHPVVLHFSSMVWWHKRIVRNWWPKTVTSSHFAGFHARRDFDEGWNRQHLWNCPASWKYTREKKLNQVPSQSPKVMVPGVWVLCFRWNFPNLHFGVGGNSFISGSNRWWFKFGMASHTLNHWFHRVDVLRWKVARWRSILSTTVWRWGEFPQKNDGPKNDSSERHFRLCEGKLFMILIIRYPYNIYVYAYYIYIIYIFL